MTSDREYLIARAARALYRQHAGQRTVGGDALYRQTSGLCRLYGLDSSWQTRCEIAGQAARLLRAAGTRIAPRRP